MPVQSIIVGIGGTGAKVVEALIHLAASGNAPIQIYPVLIDRDAQNGNVRRCINVINSYSTIHESGGRGRKWAFAPSVEVQEGLLPLVPFPNLNFAAAIQYSEMWTKYQELTRALYTETQLNDPLEVGFKKRAHMGSLVIEKLMKWQDNNKGSELNLLVDKVSKSERVIILITGSIFGGTGSSGIVPVGRFFRRKLPNAEINAAMLTPYFVVPHEETTDSLVKSDADMQQVKIFLQMYREEIEQIFDNVFIIGSNKDLVEDDKVSDEPYVGGENQENPPHICELLAANFVNYLVHISDKDNKTSYYVFTADATEEIPPYVFRPDEMFGYDEDNNKITRVTRIKVLKQLAELLILADKNKGWAKRQPWIPKDKQDLSALVTWSQFHKNFWSNLYIGGRWVKFGLEPLERIDKLNKFKLSKKLNWIEQSFSIADTLTVLDNTF